MSGDHRSKLHDVASGSVAVKPEHQVSARCEETAQAPQPLRRIGHVMQHPDAQDDVELHSERVEAEDVGAEELDVADAEFTRLPARVREAPAAPGRGGAGA